jgi:phenylacetate-coenzyme A ligase PaaK-like adenylate-forming protein
MIGNKALELGNYLQKIGKNLVNFGVEKIEISGEPFSRFKKKTEKLCGVEIIDMYASAELSITAFECPCHEGLHVTENRILLSTIDPETKEEKEEGQITATTLYREVDYPGIFLINKEMGDEAKLFKGECACGRNTLRITPPERIDDIFSIETKKFNPRVIENLLYDDKFTGKYIVVKYIDKDTREVKKLQIRTEVKELLPCSSSELLPKVIEAFAQSNPNTYEVLNKLERERKIEVIYKPEKTLYEGIEKYIKKGGKSTVFVEVVI